MEINKEKIDFLLRYAKVGILESLSKLDEIEKEELKTKYIGIKIELTNPVSQSVQSVPGGLEKIKDTSRTGEENAAKKWFKGIAGRQKKYQEEHKGGIM